MAWTVWLRGLLLPALLLCLLSGQGCRYSFTGGAIPPDVKTLTVENFANNAPIVIPTLSQAFSEKLRTKFVQQSSLSLKPREGDLKLSGSITDYSIVPMNVQSDQTAAQNKLSITVQVKFENNRYPDQSWDQSFTQFALYPSSTPLNSVQDALIEQINEQLAQDIFTKAIARW